MALIIAAALLRVLNLDHGQSFHPDERHIVMTVSGMSWDNLNPKTFAYGSFPFYLMFFVAKGLTPLWPGAFSYDGLFLVGRAISVLFGVLGVWLTFILGRSLSGRAWIGLVAAALLAANPFHIQLSRYATVDGILTTLNLAALLGCVQLVASAGKRGKWLTAIAAGLSLSTKISSLSLALPIGLALIFAFGIRGFWKQGAFWKTSIGMGVVTILTCFLTQPYAVLDFATFQAHTTEQVNMVRGLWRPPYTIQYEGTTPYLYHLQQMFDFTLGIPVFLSFIVGLIAVLRQSVARFDPRWMVLLIWGLVVFLIVGRYQVKFPRYFLPLYPLIMVLAACGLAWVANWFRAKDMQSWAVATLGAVLCFAAFSGLAFVQIYREPHVYEQSSRWIYDNVPRGSRIVGVHWDDKLPLTLPGLSPHEHGFRFEGPEEELPVYEPDNPRKLSMVMQRLAEADYLVFPTPRTYGSLMRVPEEYPLTTRMFQLLFAEQLGFELLASFKVRPSLLGRVLDDDVADESFYVYDHPKVLVFRNVGRLNTSELVSKVMAPDPSRDDLPNRASILRAEAGEISGGSPPVSSGALEQVRSVLAWYLLALLFSLLLLPLFSSIFSSSPDLGYAASRVLGIPLVGFLLWFVGIFLSYPLSSGAVWILLSMVLAVALQWGWHHRAFLQMGWRSSHREVLWIELLFCLSFFGFLVLRAFNPEIFWGEKPMDLTFLNYFTRLESLPPDDPWFFRPGEGAGMSYYYLGFFAYAQLLKLAAISGGIGYNLALATVGASTVIAAYGVLLWTLRSRVVATGGALVIVLSSNFEVLYLWLVEGRVPNFDLYWASSRMMTSPSITEYPLWSFIFADFHPHVMALPVTMMLIGLATAPLMRVIGPGKSPIAAAIVAVVWGMLVGLNTWDAITSGLLVAAAALIWLVHILAGGVTRSVHFPRWAISALVFAVVGIVIHEAFSRTSHASVAVSWGYVYPNEFNSFSQLFRHVGVWLVPIVTAFFFVVVRDSSAYSRRQIFIAGLVATLLAAAPISMSIVHGVTDLPWGILATAGALLWLGGVLVQSSMLAPQRVVGGMLVIFSGLIILGAELFFLMDRMNTIFKFYYPLWSFLGVATVLLAHEAWRTYRNGGGSWRRSIAVGLVGGSLALGLAGTVLNLWIMVPFVRVEGPRPTLDGTAYLERIDGDEARMIRYLNQHIKGIEPVVEAFGPSYAEFTRVAMHTGLPTVLGWEHHIHQRGASRYEIEQRKRDLREVYMTTSVDRLREILKKYGASLVVVGNVERRAFPRSSGVVFAPEGVAGVQTVKTFGPVALLRVD